MWNRWGICQQYQVSLSQRKKRVVWMLRGRVWLDDGWLLLLMEEQWLIITSVNTLSHLVALYLFPISYSHYFKSNTPSTARSKSKQNCSFYTILIIFPLFFNAQNTKQNRAGQWICQMTYWSRYQRNWLQYIMVERQQSRRSGVRVVRVRGQEWRCYLEVRSVGWRCRLWKSLVLMWKRCYFSQGLMSSLNMLVIIVSRYFACTLSCFCTASQTSQSISLNRFFSLISVASVLNYWLLTSNYSSACKFLLSVNS